jgi:acyl-CoA synthetase (AMP-forming)/AMP-acid ligase II
MSIFWNYLESFDQIEAVRLPDGSSVTYRELLERADRIVDSVAEGSLVALECENVLECVAAYLGCLRKGVVPVLIDSALENGLRESLYERYSPVAIWGRQLDTGDFGWRMTGCISPPLHPDLALLLSTSGTTGSPRLVRLSCRNLQENAESIVSYLGMSGDDRAITSLPMHYSYGLSIVNTHLLAGAALLLTADSLMERSFWQFMKDGQATSFAGVPTMYEMLKRLRIERMELPALRTMTQAGGRLLPESVTWFGDFASKRKIDFFVMYGQTEATARMSYLPVERLLDKPSSIGVPIPGGEFSLRDANGTLIEQADEAGELVYRGSNVMMGYAENADDLSRGDELGGVLATGDLARRDADGYYYIVGRLKRFIKIHGNRISLDEVERRIQQRGIAAYATGYDDKLIVALAETGISSTELALSIIKEYKLHHSVVQVVACREVPLTSSGKVNYPELLETVISSQEGN